MELPRLGQQPVTASAYTDGGVLAPPAPTRVRERHAVAKKTARVRVEHARLVLAAAQAATLGTTRQALVATAELTVPLAALRVQKRKGSARLPFGAGEVTPGPALASALPPPLPPPPAVLAPLAIKEPAPPRPTQATVAVRDPRDGFADAGLDFEVSYRS